MENLYVAVLAIAAFSLCAVCSEDNNDFTNCSHDLAVLETALYTPRNVRELNRIFYPPRTTPSRFIKVTYKIEGHNCSVTYIWAIGGFLLMQPPKIFQLTSLYFSTSANDLTDLVLKLPSECWPLVVSKEPEKNCTCSHQDDNILDILTQQLNVYAKYNDKDSVVRDASFHVQAICDSELKQDYYTNATTKLFMACTLIIPAFFIGTVSTVARSFHEEINTQLALKQNYGILASLITVGIFTQGVIVGIDAAAMYYVAHKQYEYSNYTVQHTINLYITFITLGFDTGIGTIMLICLLYFWCTLCHRDFSNCKCAPCFKCCLEYCLPCCLIPFLYAVFGSKYKQERVWKMPKNYTKNINDATEANKVVYTTTVRRTSWILLIMLTSPLFSIASHGGYILAAWLTEPSKATETALIAVAVLIYTSLVFRQCYVTNARVNLHFKCWSFGILFYPIWQCLRHCFRCCLTTTSYYIDGGSILDFSETEMKNEAQDKEELGYLLEGHKKKDREEHFNTQALCIVLGWALLVVGSLAFTIVAFYEVPFKTLDLATYLLNVFQILIVLIAALITYKVFMVSEPEINRFIKRVRKAYEVKAQPLDDHFDDLEAVGVVTGNALDAIIKRAA